MLSVGTNASWSAAQDTPYQTGTPVAWPGGGQSIPAGSIVEYASFKCTGLTRGVTCLNLTTGAGFTIRSQQGSLLGSGQQSSAQNATQVVHWWPTESSVPLQTGDLCSASDTAAGGGAPADSSFAVRPQQFSCGGIGATIRPICMADGKVVICIGWGSEAPIKFRTSADTSRAFNVPANPDPLSMLLSNGQTCYPVYHDQALHYQGRSGFYYCDGDTATLLADDTSGTYFDKSQPTWTVQYDVGTNKPITMAVRKVVYAG